MAGERLLSVREWGERGVFLCSEAEFGWTRKRIRSGVS